MIPISLSAQNFMTYADLELDFTQFQIACLSGQNGSGKSSILDAMTWSLFEKSRSNERDDVIRLGEKEVRVQFVFQVENQIYRVIRAQKRRSKGKQSAKSSLELQIKSENGFRAISEKNKRDTQSQIHKVLNMDYALFVNSSFILQGKADLFTTSDPKERKRILADVLNLKVYDQLYEEAKKERLLQKNHRLHLMGQLDQLTQSMGSESELTSQRETEVNALETCQSQAAIQQAEHDNLRTQMEQFSSAQLRFDTHQAALKKAQDLFNQQTQEKAELENTLLPLGKLLEQKEKIQEGYALLQNLQKEQEDYLDKVSTLNQLVAEKQRCLDTLNREKHTLDLALEAQKSQEEHVSEQLKQVQAILKDAPQIEKDHALWESHQAAYDLEKTKAITFQDLTEKEHDLRQQFQNQLNTLTQEFQRVDTEWKRQGEQIAGKTSLESERDALKKTLKTLERYEQEIDKIKDQGQQNNATIDRLKDEVKRFDEEIQNALDRAAHFQEHMDTVCPTCEQVLRPKDAEVLIQNYRQEAQRWTQKKSQHLEQLQFLDTEVKRLREAYQARAKRLKPKTEKLQQLGDIQAQLQKIEALLPDYEALCAQYQALKTQIESPFPELKSAIEAVTQKRQALDFSPQHMKKLETELKTLQKAPWQFQELQKARASKSELEQKRQAAQAKIAELNATLNHENYAQEARENLKALEIQMAPLIDIPKQLEALKERISKGEIYQEKFLKLERAEVQWAHLQQQLEKLAVAMSQSEQEKTEHQGALKDLETTMTQAAQIEAELKKVSLALGILQEQVKSHEHKIYAIDQSLKLLANDQKQLQELENEAAKTEKEIFYYDELVKIFGKDGIQAVVIENAIPEIEHTANQMLSQMTEGRMHIKFQTLKSLKTSKDKLKETLEILISDEMGTRNYETFSAGEAFRVNFAIRLAVSHLLARRAGAKLQTLVIDEGFGTQDAQGKTRLIEAINTVAQYFHTILVITHVDDLKSLFPCRLEVRKEPDGSKVQIVQ